MKHNRSSGWFAWAFKSIAIFAGFIFLACYFNKWWIVLPSIFFMSGFESRRAASRICDGCGKTFYSLDLNKIDDETKALGWIRKRNGDKWEDYCPECQNLGRHLQ